MFSRRQNPDQETQTVWWSENLCPSGAHLQCKFHPQVVFSLYVSLHVIILWRYRYRLAFRRRRRLTHSAVIIIIYIWIIRHVFSKNCLCVIFAYFSSKKKVLLPGQHGREWDQGILVETLEVLNWLERRLMPTHGPKTPAMCRDVKKRVSLRSARDPVVKLDV